MESFLCVIVGGYKKEMRHDKFDLVEQYYASSVSNIKKKKRTFNFFCKFSIVFPWLKSKSSW